MLARKQLETGPLLTNLRHCTVALSDPTTKQLLTLADGTRTIDQLVSDLAAAVPHREPEDSDEAGAAAKLPVISRENVEGNLKFLAKMALLVN